MIAEVKVDDEPAVTTKPIALENDCHTIWANAKGKRGAEAWIFLEERP